MLGRAINCWFPAPSCALLLDSMVGSEPKPAMKPEKTRTGNKKMNPTTAPRTEPTMPPKKRLMIFLFNLFLGTNFFLVEFLSESSSNSCFSFSFCLASIFLRMIRFQMGLNIMSVKSDLITGYSEKNAITRMTKSMIATITPVSAGSIR